MPFVWSGLGLGFVAAVAAISLQAYRITTTPQTYVSLSKLVAGSRMSMASNSEGYHEYLNDFYGTIIETLESSEMRKHAIERVHLLYPELKQADAEIRVSQNKGSAIFNVACIAGDRQYAQVFLNALLDEFRAFREMVREQQRNKAVQALAEDVVKAEKEVRERSAKLDAFGKAQNITVLTAQQAEQTDALKRLLADKRHQEAVADASPGDKASAQTRLAVMDRELASLKEEIASTSAKVMEHDRLKREAELAEGTRKEVFDLMHKFTVAEQMSGDSVMVMERASKAVEDVQPWSIKLLFAGVLGFFGGFVLIMIIGAIVVASGPSSKAVTA